MARAINQLAAVRVRNLKEPGRYADGGNLYLQITDAGVKSWLFRFMLRGKAREMGLGPVRDVDLKTAREKAADCRKKLLDGIDPIEANKAAQAEAKAGAAGSVTFREAAETYIEAHRAGWRNAKHVEQWRATLGLVPPKKRGSKAASYDAMQEFIALPVATIDTGHVLKVIEPIWARRTETASRLRGRIEAVLNWAATRNYRKGENPARWRGHLENLLPHRSKVRRVQHHAALPYAKISEFMEDLRQEEGTAARAFEFCILTATRTSEVIGAKWNEVDLDVATWIIPADRIKARKEHRIPLSTPALTILREQLKTRSEGDGDFVFPGRKRGSPLSTMAFLMTLRRLSREDITAHGFRSTFRDWAAERTNYPREVVEMALAHAISDKVEAAYRRGDLFEKRRLLMERWANYCAQPAKPVGEVVSIMNVAAVPRSELPKGDTSREAG